MSTYLSPTTDGLDAPWATEPRTSEDRIRNDWANIGGRIRRRWHKLTDDDVLFPGGDANYLARVVQDRYGVDRREAVLQVYEFESEL